MTHPPDNNTRRDLFAASSRSRPSAGPPRAAGTIYPRRRRRLWRVIRRLVGCVGLVLVCVVAGVGVGLLLLIVLH